MPEDIEPRHSVMDLLDESSVEALNPGHARAPLTFAAKQHESRAPENLTGQSARDAADQIEALLLGHRADDAANNRGGRPTTLAPPVPRPFHYWSRQSGVNDVDSIGRNSRFHHHGFDRVRDRDECVDAVPV